MKFFLRSILILICISVVTLLHAQSSHYNVLVIRDDNSGTPERIFDYVSSLGFNTSFKHADSINIGFLDPFHAVILSCGRNTNSCVYENMREALINYSENAKGGIIVEGGHVGYNVSVFPVYSSFRNKVIKIVQFFGNDGGNLSLNQTHSSSPLVNFPNQIPPNLDLSYESEGDQDFCSLNPPAQLLFYTERNQSMAGILAFPSAENASIVNLLFNFSVLEDTIVAKNLLENILTNIIQNTISINPISTYIPDKFKLYQNFPNPFNPHTIIRFDISQKVLTTIEIFDALGRRIKILLNSVLNAGRYEVNFDAENLKSGIYFYVMKAGSYTDSGKMMIVK